VTSKTFGWDRWEARALARGVSPELAALGRALLKIAHEKGVAVALRAEFGRDDFDEAMIENAVSDPAGEWARWHYLMSVHQF
jgi:hypothetical protein